MPEPKEVGPDPKQSATAREPSALDIEAAGRVAKSLYANLWDKQEARRKAGQQWIGRIAVEQFITDLQPALEHLGIDVYVRSVRGKRGTHKRSWTLRAGDKTVTVAAGEVQIKK